MGHEAGAPDAAAHDALGAADRARPNAHLLTLDPRDAFAVWLGDLDLEAATQPSRIRPPRRRGRSQRPGCADLEVYLAEMFLDDQSRPAVSRDSGPSLSDNPGVRTGATDRG